MKKNILRLKILNNYVYAITANFQAELYNFGTAKYGQVHLTSLPRDEFISES